MTAKPRRSFFTKGRKNALHTVSAWSCQHKLVLGQVAVDSKSNEIKAIPELLTLLDIKNSIITLDAMGCQHDIAVQIVKQKADYIFALKIGRPAAPRQSPICKGKTRLDTRHSLISDFSSVVAAGIALLEDVDMQRSEEMFKKLGLKHLPLCR